jgi:hypothetical protein
MLSGLCEEEAVIVRKIYDLYVKHGFGVTKIANALTAEGIKTRAGKNFNPASINHIVRNITYIGVLRSGETRSPVIEDLRIIPDGLYHKAQDIMKKRTSDAADARTYPLNTESRCLLNGKIYCADCGSRLVVTSNGRCVEKDGQTLRKLRYICYGKTRKQTDCKGQTGYSADRLDDVVDGIIRHIFNSMRSIPKSEVVASGLLVLQKEQEIRYKAAQRDHAKAAADLTELKGEVLKAIRGESKFSPELLSELIKQAETKLTEIEAVRDTSKQELDGCKHRMEEMQIKYDEVMSWTELYDVADLTAKKMIVANLVNHIKVGTSYQIHIDLNIDLAHFNIHFDFCTYKQKEAA